MILLNQSASFGDGGLENDGLEDDGLEDDGLEDNERRRLVNIE